MNEVRRWSSTGTLSTLVAAIMIATTAPYGRADDLGEIELLRREIQTLRERDTARAREIDELRRELQSIRSAMDAPTSAPAAATPAASNDPAQVVGDRKKDSTPPAPASALDRAVGELPVEPSLSIPAVAGTTPGIVSRRVGSANLRLIDIGMNVLWAAGGSTVPDPEIEGLEQGAHDPRQRGFTLQQAELSLAGAVDPYVRGEAFIVGTTDGVELEEAFLTSTALPWGLQLEAGTFFTEFGINNAQHPHQWAWVDQPVINSRMFGGEALRGPGFRLGWLTPLPWFSEVHIGMQNPNEGEFTSSFIGDEPVGDRPQVKQNVDNLGDLLYLTRWVNSWDLDDSLTTRIGVSGLFGPNGTGNSARTYIYGADMLWRWQPPKHFRGWPFVAWQTELMKRDFYADRFVASTGVEGGGEEEDDLSSAILRDWGFYTQALWGVRRPWALGVRYEYASGSGTSLSDGRNQDALRDDRHRLSPLVVWQPTEFTRFRLQYNFDRARFLEEDDAHSFWFSMEILYGSHMAHPF